jgi:hypothetical protein
MTMTTKNGKRIRELTDECVALADDRTISRAERELRILTRQRAIRALLQAEKQAPPKTLDELTGEFDQWVRVGAADKEPEEDTAESKISAGNALIRRNFR